jgi:hypothetical protein
MPYNRIPRPSIATIAILCLSTLISQASPASYKFLPGYFIEKTGDTVLCDIDFKDWAKNPLIVVANVKGQEKTFGPADIAAFGVSGYAD